MDPRTDQALAMDRGALDFLRIERARAALEKGDPTTAIVEAEELLDVSPDNLDALLLVGEASLDLGDAVVGHAALSRYCELNPNNAVALSALAVSSFELTWLELSVASARRATTLDPRSAEAWFFLGLSLERVGEFAQSLDALSRAAQLSPEAYPLIEPVNDADWARAVEKGRRLLPRELSAWYREVPLRVEHFPELDELRATQPPLSPTTPALILGPPPEDGTDPWVTRPEALRLYRGNLERIAAMEGDLPRRIAEAMRGEALEWLALPDDAYPLRG